MPKRRLIKNSRPATSLPPGTPVHTGPSQYMDEIDNFHQSRDSSLKLRASTEDFRDGLLSASERDSSSGEWEEVLSLRLSSSSEADAEDQLGAVREYFSDESEGELGWGRKKRTFYHTDFVGDENRGRRQDETDLALEEERDAISLQRRLVEGFTERDYLTHDVLSVLTASRPDTIHTGAREQTDLLQESPELNELLQDLSFHISLLNSLTLPCLSLARDVTHSPANLMRYLNTSSCVSLSYCCGILFYLSLRARRESVETHPVCERLVSCRSLIAQLSVLDKDLHTDLREWLQSRAELNGDMILSADSDQLTVSNNRNTYVEPNKDSHNSIPDSILPDDRNLPNSAASEDKYASLTPLEYYDEIMREREEKKKRKQTNKQQNNNTPDNPIRDTESTKRAIDYAIRKNKGLTPRRKKELRNPRVRQRMRYKRALKHRKGQVPVVRSRSSLYPGEMTGIRDDISKSRKIR